MKHEIKIQYSTSDGSIFADKDIAMSYERMLYVMQVSTTLGISGPVAEYLVANDLENETYLFDADNWGIYSPNHIGDLYKKTYKRIAVVHGTFVQAAEYAMDTLFERFHRCDGEFGEIKKFPILNLT